MAEYRVFTGMGVASPSKSARRGAALFKMQRRLRARDFPAVGRWKLRYRLSVGYQKLITSGGEI
ncbi:hypothetical protein KCP77_17340 [Salmonella enterica subsp. enterica]|nr:hypothetical protein KCP77_17340 [Salmonella enterica subsp. enterica]